ncbi:MAG: aminoglycoside phosphotransferase family protein [Nocardioidaceae bacterium]
MSAGPASPLTDYARSRLVERFGPRVRTWCDKLPAELDVITAVWGLRLGHALPAGGTSVVLACRTRDDEPVVLKLTPDPQIARDEAKALDTWCDSPHVVALLDADLARGALLLEAFDPPTPLRDTATGWDLSDIAALLADLAAFRPLGPGHGLPDLRERVAFLFDLTETRYQHWPEASRHLPHELLDDSRAGALALADDGPVALLHGDLHPGNVLPTRRGLVAIDPRPCLGDPTFDTLDWLLAGTTTPGQLEANLDELARHLSAFDPARAWTWCQATAAANAVGPLRRNPADPHGRFLLQLATGTH